MSICASRLAVVTFVVLTTTLSASAAGASNWSTSLSGASAGQARSSGSSAPSEVTATCTASNQKSVVVSWQAVAHAKYSVWRSSTSSSTGYTLTASNVATTTWTSSALPTGQTYWFEVSATIGSNWTSSLSAPTTGRVIRSTNPNCT